MPLFYKSDPPERVPDYSDICDFQRLLKPCAFVKCIKGQANLYWQSHFHLHLSATLPKLCGSAGFATHNGSHIGLAVAHDAVIYLMGFIVVHLFLLSQIWVAIDVQQHSAGSVEVDETELLVLVIRRFTHGFCSKVEAAKPITTFFP